MGTPKKVPKLRETSICPALFSMAAACPTPSTAALLQGPLVCMLDDLFAGLCISVVRLEQKKFDTSADRGVLAVT